MSETSTQKDTFSEKSRLLDIALKYTNGDMERAKLMVAGQYNDVKIIKGKFDIENVKVFGIFLVFVNVPNNYIMNITTLLMQNDNVIQKASIFDSWKTFYSDLADFTQSETDNALPSYDFNLHLSESLENYDIYSAIEQDNLEDLTDMIKDIISKFYSVNVIVCKLSLDAASSLNLELSNVPVEEPGTFTETHEPEKVEDVQTDKLTEIESRTDYVISGRVIISPIKGKYINDIKTGDKIKVLLTGNDNVSRNVAKTLNAMSEEDEILPITIRITEKIPMEKKGYYIYGLAAKNVLVRIVEEENVKIETEQAQKATKTLKSEKTKSDSKMIIYLVLMFGLLFLAAFLILIIL
jgi:hypothetical protein